MAGFPNDNYKTCDALIGCFQDNTLAWLKAMTEIVLESQFVNGTLRINHILLKLRLSNINFI